MALDPRTGLNSYWLIQLLENVSQLQVGYDNDVDDINQDLVLQFLKEGFQTIVDTDTRWPWFETNYITSIDTETNQGSGVIYGNEQVFTITSAYAPPPYVTLQTAVSMQGIKELVNVVSIQGTEQFNDYGVELIYISQDQGERWWVGNINQPSIPGYFSLWSNSLQVWPRPNQLYTLYVRGYREPNLDWLLDSNNSESLNYVDLDLELQACLITYTMSRIYQFQEDAEMARVYRDQFVTNLKNYQDYLTAPSSNQPLVYSGGLQLSGIGYGYNVPGIRVMPSSSAIPSAIAW
jgi:hypothetical protein